MLFAPSGVYGWFKCLQHLSIGPQFTSWVYVAITENVCIYAAYGMLFTAAISRAFGCLNCRTMDTIPVLPLYSFSFFLKGKVTMGFVPQIFQKQQCEFSQRYRVRHVTFFRSQSTTIWCAWFHSISRYEFRAPFSYLSLGKQRKIQPKLHLTFINSIESVRHLLFIRRHSKRFCFSRRQAALVVPVHRAIESYYHKSAFAVFAHWWADCWR